MTLLLVGVLFIATAVVMTMYSLGIVGQSTKAVRERLKVTNPAQPNPVADPNRVAQSQKQRSGLMKFIASASAVKKIERDITLAGHPAGWTLRRILVLKAVLVAGTLFLLFAMVSRDSSLLVLLTGVIGVIAGYFAPDIIVGRRAEARQKVIEQELPDILDQVTISIEAGLGFESAFARIGERRSGALAQEIVRTVQDMRLGMSRRDAYQALADRTDVDDLRTFVKAIIQAEQYGVSIASVVRTQAVEMRFRRRTRAEALANKVPVKILFPLLVCILPVLFVVVLTPALINLSSNVQTR